MAVDCMHSMYSLRQDLQQPRGRSAGSCCQHRRAERRTEHTLAIDELSLEELPSADVPGGSRPAYQLAGGSQRFT